MLTDDQTAVTSDELLSVIAGRRFPCVGAKSAMAQGMLKTVICHSLKSAADDARIHSELVEWVVAYQGNPRGLRSLAAIFEQPVDISEGQFENLMWERLQALAEIDSSKGYTYDRSVSPNPHDPNFALSLGGGAFFVVGLHRNASRLARQVARPTLVFNLHDQFERLRFDGIYERMRETIIRRDVALAGSSNPMLARFGETSGARQYSGRAVGAEWRCPFHDPRAQ